MAGPLDIDDDMQRMVLRKAEATAEGGRAFDRPVGPQVARSAVSTGHIGD